MSFAGGAAAGAQQHILGAEMPPPPTQVGRGPRGGTGSGLRPGRARVHQRAVGMHPARSGGGPRRRVDPQEKEKGTVAFTDAQDAQLAVVKEFYTKAGEAMALWQQQAKMP